MAEVTGKSPTGGSLYEFVPVRHFELNGNLYLSGMRYTVRADSDNRLDPAIRGLAATGIVEIRHGDHARNHGS